MTTTHAPRRPVAAVVTDGPEAVAVARRAARIAAEQHRPVVLLVAMLRSDFTADAVIAARVHQEARREAEAIAARTTPALESAGISARAEVVWHRGCGFRRAHQARAIALAHAAHAVGAAVIVTPVEIPVPTVQHGTEVVLVAEVGDSLLTVRRPARSRRLAEL